MRHTFFCLSFALGCALLLIVGDLEAITVWFPNAGHLHHHAPPTILGYIALYTCFVLLNLCGFSFLLYGPVADGLDLDL